MPPETRASLLLRIRDPKDGDSWTQFGEVYAPVIFRFLTRRGLQEADAGDVTQNVLLEVAKGIQKFEYKPEQGKFRNWLATISRRQLNRFWNKKSVPTIEPEEMGINQQSDAQWIDAWQSELLRSALQRVQKSVNETTWRAFEMTWIQNEPAAQASQSLEMPIDLVYSAKARVLKRVEEEVRMLGDDCGWVSVN